MAVNVSPTSQTLPSGEEGHQTTIGKTPANRLLNRFKNIAACKPSLHVTMSCALLFEKYSERYVSLIISFLLPLLFCSPMLFICALKLLPMYDHAYFTTEFQLQVIC